MKPKYKPNDPELVENILAELKRNGMFDQFRKDCISDVDTKPAYQNLQFKVESTVSKFLSSQKWSPDTNRNQLREKLRKNILDSGYLDSGIERIVDQVLYPKMAGFQSQIDDLVYSYLNIDRPKRKIKEEVKKEFNTSLLPKDLEAVSDSGSDKQKSFGSQDDLDKGDENDDDFESPAFEPLEGVVVESHVKKENDDSHLSGLSNMKSEGSISEENSHREVTQPQVFDRSMESIKQEEDESQLSQVSSGSRLSIVVHSEKDSLSPKPEVLNITEEAQMPRFSENSNSIDSRGALGKEGIEGPSVFDFKKEEIEFKGPSRKQMTLDEKLKEEIFESENKHANIFKTDDIETNSHSSDLKLEIVEHNITESESHLKIDVENDVVKEEDPSLPPPKSEISETEGKIDEKTKHSSPSDKKSSSHHKTSSKSSKHSSRDKERDEKRSSSSKHSSSHHSTSKSRHSDKDRHHSSSSRHKSSSSSNRDRHSSSKSSSSRHRSRLDHKSRDDKRHSDSHHTSRDKSISTRPEKDTTQLAVDVSRNLTPERDDVFEGPNNPEFTEPNPIEEPKTQTPTKSSPEITPDNTPKIRKVPSSHDFMSDEDDFYGFPEQNTPLTFSTPLATPAKVLDVTPGTSSQKSVLDRSFIDEDSFYGFDEQTPKKIQEDAIQDTSDTTSSQGNGKRVRKPNTKYLSNDFTTAHVDDKDDEEEITKSCKKRKRITQEIVKIVKKQKNEETTPIIDEGEQEEKLEETEMPELTSQETSKDDIKGPTTPKTPDIKEESSETPKSSKKHSKHDRSSRSSRRR